MDLEKSLEKRYKAERALKVTAGTCGRIGVYAAIASMVVLSVGSIAALGADLINRGSKKLIYKTLNKNN